MDIGQAYSFTAAENHYSYCVRTGKFLNLTKGGCIITAQSTSNKRCAITVTQQYRWHNLFDAVWDNQQLTNQPTALFKRLHKHFQLNLDESCFMCCNGILKLLVMMCSDKQLVEKYSLPPGLTVILNNK
eukprot:156994-Ditylum_brightwellii.AAC.1